MSVRLTLVTQSQLTPSGQWMAERLGGVGQHQHFVPVTNEKIMADNWEIGYITVCGVLATIVGDDYLAKLPKCRRCVVLTATHR